MKQGKLRKFSRDEKLQPQMFGMSEIYWTNSDQTHNSQGSYYQPWGDSMKITAFLSVGMSADVYRSL